MMTPPKAEKRPYPITIHGDTRVDDYYWLRDDERADRQVLDYLQAENAYTDAMLKPQQALRETLYEEMVARIPQQEHSVPYVRHGYRYQTRYEPGNEYAISVRQPQAESERWEVLIDGNQRAENHEFYTLGGLDVSPDNQRLGVAEDFLSRHQYDIRFKNLADGSWADEVLENTSGSFEWANDSSTVYYVRKHAKTLLPYQVYRHVVGSDPQQDELIYEELDDTFYVGLEKTTSERFILGDPAAGRRPCGRQAAAVRAAPQGSRIRHRSLSPAFLHPLQQGRQELRPVPERTGGRSAVADADRPARRRDAGGL